jgi:hypothetical protein
MSRETWDEERLGELLRLLTPAPRGWVDAAAELPRLRSVLDEFVERAEADATFRAALVTDLEAALADAGLDPTPRLLESVRERLQL